MTAPIPSAENHRDVAIPMEPSYVPAPSFRSSAQLCGREVTKCGANLIFLLGYVASGAGIFYAAVHSLPVTGGLSAGAMCVQALAHRWWTKYSNLTSASETVHSAALEAHSAASTLQQAASQGQMLAQRVSNVAVILEKGSEKLSEGISVGTVQEIDAKVSEFMAETEGLESLNIELKSEVEHLKTAIVPINLLVSSFKKYLLTIRKEMALSLDKIESFGSFGRKFNHLAEVTHREVSETGLSMQEILRSLSEDATLTLNALREANRQFINLLQDKNREFQSAVLSLAEVSKQCDQGQEQRAQLIERIQEQERQNVALQQRVAQIIEALELERSHWQQSLASQQPLLSEATMSISSERQKIHSLIERLESFVKDLEESSGDESAGVGEEKE